MGVLKQRIVCLLRHNRRTLAIEQAHDVRDVVAKTFKRRLDGDFHAKFPRSQAIFVFMPWPG